MIRRVRANGIDIACDSRGEGPPAVLIMGIGMPMLNWPEGFCDDLAGHGLRVIRLDNRDSGRSARLAHLGMPSLPRVTARRLGGRPIRAPYLLDDMADDVSGLLDALELPTAHIVGTSMGGMIAQAVAIRHPDRVHTLTSIMSSTGSRREMLGSAGAIRALVRPVPGGRDAAIAHTVGLLRAIGSRSHPTPEAELTDRIGRCVDHGMYADGFARQWEAILASGSRRAALRELRVPTLVIHGDEDPLVPPRGGRSTARLIPGARLEVVRGMGHDLPRPLWPEITGAIAGHVLRWAAAAQA